jgi:hypothetical protein
MKITIENILKEMGKPHNWNKTHRKKYVTTHHELQRINYV